MTPGKKNYDVVISIDSTTPVDAATIALLRAMAGLDRDGVTVQLVGETMHSVPNVGASMIEELVAAAYVADGHINAAPAIVAAHQAYAAAQQKGAAIAHVFVTDGEFLDHDAVHAELVRFGATLAGNQADEDITHLFLHPDQINADSLAALTRYDDDLSVDIVDRKSYSDVAGMDARTVLDEAMVG